jgi:hypothetical protein
MSTINEISTPHDEFTNQVTHWVHQSEGYERYYNGNALKWAIFYHGLSLKTKVRYNLSTKDPSLGYRGLSEEVLDNDKKYQSLLDDIKLKAIPIFGVDGANKMADILHVYYVYKVAESDPNVWYAPFMNFIFIVWPKAF